MMTATSSAASTRLERGRRGDADALVATIRDHDQGLRALAFRLLGSAEGMDDALQEAYVRAFRALPSFRGRSSLRTWLYRIAYNACLDELARARREVATPLDAVSEATGRWPDPAEAVVDGSVLAQALAGLAPEDRAAVLLVDAQGFGYREAGRILGVPEGTIASRLNRARTTLRRALGEGRKGVRE